MQTLTEVVCQFLLLNFVEECKRPLPDGAADSAKMHVIACQQCF